LPALGPDPLSDGIDTRALMAKLARRKKGSIRKALMDQKVLAGVGNIQAIEALWKAGIAPRSPAAALDAEDVAAVVRGLRWTIRRTLADLAKGNFGAKNPFVIYGRKGEACPRCGHALARIELGGRTTTFCPGCQKRYFLGRGIS
jgi:formamidopyrimidine-DNA glycosylase